jgi:capsular exopolysaccharide synthesis family protein
MSSEVVPSQSPLEPPMEIGRELVPYTGHAPPAPPPDRGEDGINLGRYVSALKRYKWLMLLVVLLVSAIGAVVAKFIPPSFKADSTIWVDAGGGGKSGPLQSQDLFNQKGYADLLRTDAVFLPLIHQMKLFVEPRRERDTLAFRTFDVGERFQTGKFFLELDPAKTHWSLVRSGNEVASGQVGDSIGQQLGWLWTPTAADLAKSTKKVEFLVRSPDDVNAELQKGLTVAVPEKGTFIKVSLEHKSKRLVARILNTLCSEFVSLAADLKKRQLTELRVLLDSQATAAQNNLHEAETRLKEFQTSTITQPRTGVFAVTPGLTQTTGVATNQYFVQKTQLEAMRRDRQQLETVLERSKSGAITADAFQTIPAVNSAPQLKQALADLTRAESEQVALLQRYTPEHPLVKQTADRIAELKTGSIPMFAQALIDQLKIQEQDIQSRINSASTELREAPAVTITEMKLQREYEIAEKLYQNLAERQQEARLTELSAIPDLRVLDVAVPPTKGNNSTRIKVILMAIAGGFGSAVALALLLDQIDKRFRYPEQVSSGLGLAILGAVPGIRKNRRGELAPEQAGQVVEAFRTIRLNLAHSYGSAGPVALTITSPGAGDGKSLVCANLAVSFAEAGYKTLLIDGDIRRGELHRMFGVERKPGLLDYLTGEAGVDAILRETSQRGLSVVSCGTRRHQGPELLGSAAMAELMGDMKARFNVIIVDSPPLGAGIDPFVLGTATGHMLVVFRAGETDRQMAEAKLRVLDRLPVRVLGAVLNEIQTEGVYKYYTYLYGYTADEEGTPQLVGKTGGNGAGL